MNFTKIINAIFSTTPVIIVLTLLIGNTWIYGAVDLPPIQQHPRGVSVSASALTEVPRGKVARTLGPSPSSPSFSHLGITAETYASIKGLGPRKCAQISGIIKNLHLFRGITSEYEKASIVASVASIPDDRYFMVEALITMHKLLERITSGYAISSIIRAVSAVANSDVLESIHDQSERDAIITAVIKTPDLQRINILALARRHQLFKYLKKDGFERAAIIQALGFIPEGASDQVLHQIPITCNGFELSKRILLGTSRVTRSRRA